MKSLWPPQDQVYWYLKQDTVARCNNDLSVDIAIIGGGMAGLSAAQECHKKGKRAVLLEQYYCGSGASGKSSGFITPNAELSLTDFAQRYNADAARHIWDFIIGGVENIRTNIERYNFVCDYAKQNTLVVANSKSALTQLEREHNNLVKAGYQSSFYPPNTIHNYIGSDQYFGGVGYENTFGINGYRYCQEMKKLLQNAGMMIFEETPVTAIQDHVLITPHARITADNIIICADRFIPDLNLLTKEIYHAQNHLMISEQLTDEQRQILFPAANLMVWDTDLIYTYFRITGDNRLLLGGGDLLTIYSAKANHDYGRIIKKLTNYFIKKFPRLTIQFQHSWPGLIGISKDIAPIAGPDRDKPFIYYVAAAAGLPIAAALGCYSVQHLLDGRTNLDPYFSPYRSFPISGALQSILGAKVSFALSNFMKKTVL